MEIQRIRELFPILRRRNYLNSCSLGALSVRSEERLGDFTRLWHELGAAAWYDHWWGLLTELRRRVERLFAAPAGTVALMPSTSACLAVAASSLDWDGQTKHGSQRARHRNQRASHGSQRTNHLSRRTSHRSRRTKRNRIVATELDFPTLLYSWKVRPDAQLVVLESPDGVTVDPQQFADAVDDRTLAVATSHVFFATGAVQDLTSIAEIARRAGAFTIIDGYQGAGQLPVDLPATGVDFYTAGPLKWLCGGPGLAYLYVRDELAGSLAPTITSWFATQDQFRFNPGDFRYHDDARRFELGTPALPTVHTALGGQEIVDQVGVPAIRHRNLMLADRLADGCREAGFHVRASSDPATRSAIVPVAHPTPAEAVSRLAEQGIVVDHRPGIVRASPHFYNTTDDVDGFVDALSALELPRQDSNLRPDG